LPEGKAFPHAIRIPIHQITGAGCLLLTELPNDLSRLHEAQQSRKPEEIVEIEWGIQPTRSIADTLGKTLVV